MWDLLQQCPDEAVDEPGRNEQDDDGHYRRQVEWPERRDSASKETQIRTADFVQKLLHTCGNSGIGKLNPG
jgi:hypothetical protein